MGISRCTSLGGGAATRPTAGKGSYARLSEPVSAGGNSAGAGDAIASRLTYKGVDDEGFDGRGGSGSTGEMCWGFVGGSGSAPEDMMLERDMGSARVGGGACSFLLSETRPTYDP